MQARNYGQNCSVAQACDLLGERWTLLIVRDLLIAPRRFSELEKRLKGMGTNLLSKRLKEMRAIGLLCDSAGQTHYKLSEMGRNLEPLILDIAKWSLTWVQPTADPYNTHFPDWDLLALKAMFKPDPRLETPILARFNVKDWTAWACVSSTGYSFGLGEPSATPSVNFPCYVFSLRHSAKIFESLPDSERVAAKAFVACFAEA